MRAYWRCSITEEHFHADSLPFTPCSHDELDRWRETQAHYIERRMALYAM